MSAVAGLTLSAPAALQAQEPPPQSTASQTAQGPANGKSLNQLINAPKWAGFSVDLDAQPLTNAGGLGTSGAWIQQLTLGANFSSGLNKEANEWAELDHWQVNTQLSLFSGRANYGLNIGAAFDLQSTDYPTGLWLGEASLERHGGLGPVTIKGGLLSLNPDFVETPVFAQYVHSAINDTLNLTVFGLPITPFVSPGAVVSLDLGQAGNLRLGSYWLNSQTQLAELFGLNAEQTIFQGSTQVVQWTFSNLPGSKKLGNPIPLGDINIVRQLPAPSLQLGGITSNTNIQGLNRVVYGALTLPMTLPVGLDHRLWLGVNVGLDPSHNTAPLFLTGGWTTQGIIRSRPHDVLSLGLGRTTFGPNTGLNRIYEGVIELNYNAVLNQNVSLGPVFQVILNPGGVGDVHSIVAAGLQFQLSL